MPEEDCRTCNDHAPGIARTMRGEQARGVEDVFAYVPNIPDGAPGSLWPTDEGARVELLSAAPDPDTPMARAPETAPAHPIKDFPAMEAAISSKPPTIHDNILDATPPMTLEYLPRLGAPWFEPEPVQKFQEDGRFVRPEEPFTNVFIPAQSRGYQFSVPPRMIRQSDGTWLFLPCCRVLTGPRFTGIANSSGIRHVEGQQLPDGSWAQGRIEVAPTKLPKGGFGVQFAFAATFLEQLPHYEAACCEIRLLFTVLNAHTDAVPYPHSGFSRDEDPRKSWVEDRRQDGRSYGHRADSNEASDLYEAVRATGDEYSGNDTPKLTRLDAALAAASGEIWRYMVIVIDTCCGGIRGMSDVLDVVWARTKF